MRDSIWRFSLAAVMALPAWLFAQADQPAGQNVSAALAAAQKAGKSITVVDCTVADEPGQTRQMLGPAVCIDAKGVMMTYAIEPAVETDKITKIEIVLPGRQDKRLAAKLLGIDPLSGLSFVEATDKYDWQAMEQDRQGQIAQGQFVTSAGPLMSEAGFPIYLGMAWVSAELRTPGKLVMVTGGSLCSAGSPVFNSAGKMIGLVGPQKYLPVDLVDVQGEVTVALRGRARTLFFLPISELAYILDNIPTDGRQRRPAWIGVAKFETVGKDYAAILKLDKPGVMIDQVIPGEAADKAGLKNRDIILGVNGKDVESFANDLMTASNLARTFNVMPVGIKVKLTVMDGATNKIGEVEVALTSMPMLPGEARRYVSMPLGFAAREKVPLDKFLDKGPTADTAGLIVTDVVNRGIAALSGLNVGDVIASVGDKNVITVQTLKQAIDAAASARPPQDIKMIVRRGNQGLTVTIQPPR